MVGCLDGSVPFNKGWVEYEEGFGDLNGEFWYGLRPLPNQSRTMGIDLTHSNGSKTYLHHKKFAIGSANDKYPLHISQYSGIYPADPFSALPLNGMKFSTKESDNDQWSSSCAHNSNGNAWWFN